MCGRSTVTLEAMMEIKVLSDEQRADLASWVFEQSLRERVPPTICSSEYKGADQPAHDYRVNQILHALVPRSFSERLDRILENLAILAKQPGKAVGLNEYAIYCCYAGSRDQMSFFLGAIEERGWLRQIANGWTAMQITAFGWLRIDELRGLRAKSDQVFVAMSFADELDPVWDDGLYQGIDAAGYRPLRMKELEHNDQISNRLLEEIKRSGFVVADVTGHRQGVYFEAGYAMGIGVPVIWTCRKDDLKNCHFDTRQYNHILWDTPEELAKALERRIRATISEPPK